MEDAYACLIATISNDYGKLTCLRCELGDISYFLEDF